ncbi:MAG: metallophosphoesterase, partial [Endomicrobium sp.]|nr:metallophosphoesterase [Endomicrobium sp.]
YSVKGGFVEFERNVFEAETESPLFSVSYKAATSSIESILKDFYKNFTNYIVKRLYEAKYMKVKREYYSEMPLVKSASVYSLFIKALGREKSYNMTEELLQKGIIQVIPVIVSGREIKVVVETEFLKHINLTPEDIASSIDNALKKTAAAVKTSASSINDTIYIAPYDKSPSLFFGNIDTGVIGVNKALYDIEDEALRKSLFKTGFTHEIRHSLYGHISDRSLLDSFEEAANLADVRILLEEAFNYAAQREDESVEDYQKRVKNDIVYKLSQILEDDAYASSTKTKDRKIRFLQKVKNYVFGIEDISILLNRKDLKNGDIWHIISEYVDADVYADIIEKLNGERTYYLNGREKIKSRIAELNAEAAYIANSDVLEVLSNSISELKELDAVYKRKAAERAAAIRKMKQDAKEKTPVILANQKYIFSNVANMDESGNVIAQPLSFEEYMEKAKRTTIGNAKNKSGIIDGKVIREVDNKIADARGKLENSLRSSGFSGSETDMLLDAFDKNCKAVLRLLYYNLPEHFFRRYYTDNTSVKNHSFTHSVEVLNNMFDILRYDETLLSALKKGELDMTTLVFSAFMHDLSNIVARHNHEINSTYMINAVLNNAQGISLYEENAQGEKVFREVSGVIEIDVTTGKSAGANTADREKISIDASKLKSVCLGHKKISSGEIRDEHKKYHEAGLLHDADAFSAVFNLGRLLDIWISEGAPIFNKDLTLKTRIELLMLSGFTEGTGDALNEIIRHGYVRHNSALYVTEGAKIAIENLRTAGTEAIKDFIASVADKITKIKKIETRNLTTVYSETDIEAMKRAIEDIITAYDKVIADPSYIRILDDREKYEKTAPKPVFNQADMIRLINYLHGEPVVLPTNAVISDVHGAAERFDSLLKSLLNIREDEVLTPQLLSERLLNSTINTLYVLGDNQDRGPDPITVFRLVKAIKYSGKGKFVTGNHDINALMNILGVHLPFYKGYNGIKSDYVILIPSSSALDEEINFNVRERLERELDREEEYKNSIKNLPNFKNMTNEERQAAESEFKSNIKGYTEKEFWAIEFAKYVAWANENQPKWEDSLKEAVSIFEYLYGEKIDMKSGKDILNFPEDYPDSVSPVKNDEALREWWKDILGHNVGTIIYRGLRDVNKMSLNWWKDKRAQLERISETYPLNKSYWDRLFQILDAVIKDQEERLRAAYTSGNWEQLVVDAIMYRNFESVEWSAYDWIFHSSWGDIKSGFLSVRNKELAKNGKPLLTNSTYIQDPL